ncbi:MAG TPA: DUF1508 domain-containing protein [Microbacterium sp.]|jgi:uncharacterized protein|nr:DUF1508 domain-containing protein [Microbacterium sp.]
MPAKFKLFRDWSGQFRFRLDAPDGETLAESDGFPTKDNAKRGILRVKKHAASAAVDDQTGK